MKQLSRLAFLVAVAVSLYVSNGRADEVDFVALEGFCDLAVDTPGHVVTACQQASANDACDAMWSGGGHGICNGAKYASVTNPENCYWLSTVNRTFSSSFACNKTPIPPE